MYWSCALGFPERAAEASRRGKTRVISGFSGGRQQQIMPLLTSMLDQRAMGALSSVDSRIWVR